MASLHLAMGTAGFPGPENLQKVLDVLKPAGIVEIDTAELYGSNEADLGAVGAAEQGFVISTKNPGGFLKGSLEDLPSRIGASLTKLKVAQVDILYLHAPPSVPPAEYAPAFDELHRAGLFRRFGISNFSPDEVRALHAYCADNGLVRPTVYQGNYSAVARKIEADLFPVLRELGIAFYAYSPIAGGFLTKTRAALDAGTADGRFAVDDSPLAQMYRSFYFKPAMLDGLSKWEALAKEQGVPQAELAYRWIYYHSALDTAKGNDFVILGATKLGQITQTVEGLKRGPLKPEVVKGIEEVWESVKHEAIVDNYEGIGRKTFDSSP